MGSVNWPDSEETPTGRSDAHVILFRLLLGVCSRLTDAQRKELAELVGYWEALDARGRARVLVLSEREKERIDREARGLDRP